MHLPVRMPRHPAISRLGSALGVGVGVGKLDTPGNTFVPLISTGPAAERRRLSACPQWAMFLLPYCLLLFFAAVFFWARVDALIALSCEVATTTHSSIPLSSDAAASLFAIPQASPQILASDHFSDAEYSGNSATGHAARPPATLSLRGSAASDKPEALSFLQVAESGIDSGPEREPWLYRLLPSSLRVSNPLLGALAHMVGDARVLAASKETSHNRKFYLAKTNSGSHTDRYHFPRFREADLASNQFFQRSLVIGASEFSESGGKSSLLQALRTLVTAYPSLSPLAPFPHHVEVLGLVLELLCLTLTAICLVLTHATPPGGWADVAERIASGDIADAESCFHEWKLSPPGVTAEPVAPTLRALAALSSAGASARRRHAAASALARSGVGERGASGVNSAEANVAATSSGLAAKDEVAAALLLPPASMLETQPGLDAVASEHLLRPPSVLSLSPSLLRVCGKCEWPPTSGWRAPKPDRCHHCKHCGTCVLEMDHHCPWVANCVGVQNKKHFVLTLLYAVLGLAVFLCWMGPDFARALTSLTDFPRQITVLFSYFLALLVSVLLAGMLVFHIYLLCRGLTTIEWCEKVRPAAAAPGGPHQRQPMPQPPSPHTPAAAPEELPLPQLLLQLQESVSTGTLRTAAVPAGGVAGTSSAAAGDAPTPIPRVDLLADSPLDLLAIADDDFAALPEPRFSALMRAQLYAASPYDGGVFANMCAVLGDSAIFWLLPSRWGVRQRPPYAISPRFAAFRRRVALRETWRAENASKVGLLERAWRAAHVSYGGKVAP